jgi:predicted glycosyltransferase
MIWKLQELNYDILICAREKEMTTVLLKKYGFPFTVVSVAQPPLVPLLKEQIHRSWGFSRILRQFQPDISISIMDPTLAFASRVKGIPFIGITDTENAERSILGTLPFTEAVLTPSCFKKILGPKQIFYNGNHELAYLHPNHFTPDPSVLTEIGLTDGDPFTIVRFVSWQASHDVGQHGLTLETKHKVIREFEKFGPVFITSEKPLPDEFEKYRISVSPEKMHDLLYYATLLYGESATMASECAVLGTSSIFCDYAGRGYTDEEESRYHLVYNFKLDKASQERSIEKAVELLQNPVLKESSRQKRARLLQDKIDVTAFFVWFIENYPRSFTEMKENPEIHEQHQIQHEVW